MTTIEEIMAGIQEKAIERATAVKRILEDIEKKRKEMEEGKRKYRAKFYPKAKK
ncbi:MAG: hypothetical protein L6265_09825 [Thermoplasmatales archaeon]|nr:hypothetical protein [Thermoplasmatales archaeon]